MFVLFKVKMSNKYCLLDNSSRERENRKKVKRYRSFKESLGRAAERKDLPLVRLASRTRKSSSSEALSVFKAEVDVIGYAFPAHNFAC